MAKTKKSKKQPQPRTDAPTETNEASEGAALVEAVVNTPTSESADAVLVATEEARPAEETAEETAGDTVGVAPAETVQTGSEPQSDSAAPSPPEDPADPPSADEPWPEIPAEAASPVIDGEAVPAPEASEFAEIWQGGDAPASEAQAAGEIGDGNTEAPPSEAPIETTPEGSRLADIIESLLFASDKALGIGDLKRLLGERDAKKITAAVQALMERRKGTGIEVVAFSSGWHLRTNPEHATWVSRLLAGKPQRLTRAMLETLAIIAYRQPVTRPEIDDIRGVDCGPVLRTLLDRGLVRIIGKKEEVGRPMLYGTTPEFLRIFNLRDLAELPTLREFYELSVEDQSRVEAEHGPEPEVSPARPEVTLGSITRSPLVPEEEDADPLLDELEEASRQAKVALGDQGKTADEPATPDEPSPERADPPDAAPLQPSE